MQTQDPQLDNADDEIDLIDLWQMVAEKRRWVAVSTVGAALVALVVAFVLTPVYHSEVSMVPADESEGGRGGLSALASLGGVADFAGLSVGAVKSEFLATLKSRALIAEFVEQNDLLPLLFDHKWDPEAKKWKSDDPKKLPTIGDAYELLNKELLNIAQDKKTGVIVLSIEWKDRTQAAEWANDIVRRANKIMRMRAIEEAQRSIDYLNKELQKTSVVEIQQAIYRLMEANYKTASIANAREQYAFKIIDPAVPADEKRRVKPKRLMIVSLATLAGAFLGVLAIFAHRGWQGLRQRHTERLLSQSR